MGRLFGTDGARGVANTELSCETAMAIGRAAAMVLAEAEHHKPKVAIGKDTRISSDMLEAALVAGFCSVGADVLLLGVLPTPAVAYLVKAYGADAGVMISASHNPCEYNGIKIFNSEGYKLSDALEEEKESLYRALCLASPDFALAPGLPEFLDALREREIPRNIATASALPNVRFFFEYLPLGRWFDFMTRYVFVIITALVIVLGIFYGGIG